MRGQSPQNVSGNPGGAATSAQEFQGSSCWSLWVSGYGTAGARRAGRGECPGCPRKDGCGGTFRACQADGMEPPCAQQGPAEGVGGCQDLRLPESTLNSFRAVGAPVVLGEGGRGGGGGNTGQDPRVQAGRMWHISRGEVRAVLVSPAHGWPCPPGGPSSCFLCFPGLSPGPLHALS